MPASVIVTASSSANSLDAYRSGSENSGTAISQRKSVMRANRTGSRMTSWRSSAVGGPPRVGGAARGGPAPHPLEPGLGAPVEGQAGDQRVHGGGQKRDAARHHRLL